MSTLKRKRWSQTNKEIEQSSDWGLAMEFVKNLKLRQPRSAVWENVIGSSRVAYTAEESESMLHILIQTIKAEAPYYSCVVHQGCASRWVPGQRSRIFLVCFHEDCGADMCTQFELEMLKMTDHLLYRRLDISECLLPDDDPLVLERLAEREA
jgi:site-specific DNA-cytosine methylase